MFQVKPEWKFNTFLDTFNPGYETYSLIYLPCNDIYFQLDVAFPDSGDPPFPTLEKFLFSMLNDVIKTVKTIKDDRIDYTVYINIPKSYNKNKEYQIKKIEKIIRHEAKDDLSEANTSVMYEYHLSNKRIYFDPEPEDRIIIESKTILDNGKFIF